MPCMAWRDLVGSFQAMQGFVPFADVGGRDHPEETWVIGTYVDHVYINLGYPNFDTQALKDSDLDLHQC